MIVAGGNRERKRRRINKERVNEDEKKIGGDRTSELKKQETERDQHRELKRCGSNELDCLRQSVIRQSNQKDNE